MTKIEWKNVKSPKERIQWGPLVYTWQKSGRSLTNIIHDAVTWASTNSVEIRDTQVIPIGNWFDVKIFYVKLVDKS